MDITGRSGGAAASGIDHITIAIRLNNNNSGRGSRRGNIAMLPAAASKMDATSVLSDQRRETRLPDQIGDKFGDWRPAIPPFLSLP
jgi:hypothetical protein